MPAKLYRIRLDCKKICAKNSAVCAKFVRNLCEKVIYVGYVEVMS